jgi:hypothetical protein
MSHEQNQPVSSPDSGIPDSARAALIARRRLLRGGLGIAPVLLASAPRSVMATGGNCVPASSFASINASRPDVLQNCTGHSPPYWKACAASAWPSTCGPSVPFDNVFSGSKYPGKTMLQMMDLGETGQDGLAKHLAAALLNARTNLTPATVLDETTIKSVWNACRAAPYCYHPTAGIDWYADYSVPSGNGGCIAWLKSTMPA